MKNKKLVVMNFVTGSVTVYDYDENIWESPEDFEDENGKFPIDSNCHYMVVKKFKLTVK